MANANTDSKPRAGLAGLHAYQVALEFYRGVLAATRHKLRGHIVEQLTRAAESVVLNIAEAHPTTGADRARRFRIAANEASECGAALDLLELRGDLAAGTLGALRGLLDRERAMLWRLSRG
jgi:four helix bundle protein